MAQIPFKPRGEVTDVIKEMKEGYDRPHDPDLTMLEPTLIREARMGRQPIHRLWAGEELHQVGLRHERRGQYAEALRLYRFARHGFSPDELMGPARVMRDEGLLLSRRLGDHDAGMELVDSAQALLGTDVNNDKAERQRRVTFGYMLRAQILAHSNTRRAVPEIIELALDGCEDFCPRDKDVLLDFAVRHADGAAKRALQLRQLDIHVARGRPLRVAGSMTRIVIDAELLAAKKIASGLATTIFRRE